jgi:TonB family protein
MRFLAIAGFLLCALIGLGQDSGLDVLQRYGEELKQSPTNPLLHFRLGELLFEQRNYQSSANNFRAALEGDPHPAWIDTWAHIDLGEIFDITNQRSRATWEYQAALRTHDDTDGAQGVARRRLEGSRSSNPVLHHVSLEDLPQASPAAPIVHVPAQYSVEGKVAGLEGTVYLNATVAADGSVSNFHVLQPLGLGLDEAAIEAASRWKFQPVQSQSTTIRVDFLLPSRHSRWHLLRVVLATPDGVSRAHFLSAPYPEGDGIGQAAAESAGLLAVMGRQAVVSLEFQVDEAGHPILIHVQEATNLEWGEEAASIVRHWQFSPARKDGIPVRVPCTVDLVWGEKQFTADSLRVAAVTFVALTNEVAER